MWYGLRVMQAIPYDSVRRAATAARPEDAPALTSRIQQADPEIESPNCLNAVPFHYAAHGYTARLNKGSVFFVELSARV